MTPDIFTRIKAIYGKASVLRDHSKRAAYLDRACAGDDTLRAEVESLLAQDEKTEPFMGIHSSIVGKSLLHYEVLEEIGRGGMGLVYKARDKRLDRVVVLKTLATPMLSKPAHRRRFVSEARYAAALSHPNIVTVYGREQVDGADYIVMEYVAGETLARAIPPNGWDPTTACSYARQVVAALVEAHAKDLAHRDLKTANIMITHGGVAKVLDFGLAGLVRKQPKETCTARSRGRKAKLRGTPEYMAPEQIQGRAGDYRSDIFAFGVILYEMLTGTHPFSGRTREETLRLIENRNPPELPSNIPEPLQELVLRCLKKHPEDRFGSARELSAALEALMANQTTPEPAKPDLRMSSERRAHKQRDRFQRLAARLPTGISLREHAIWILPLGLASAAVVLTDSPKSDSSAGKTREAISSFAAATPDSAHNSAETYNRAVTLMEAKNWEEAMKLFDQVLKADPRNTRALYNRAACLQNMKRWKEAIPDFTEIIRRDPRNDRAYHNRAVCFMNLKMFREALSDLNDLIEIKPSAWVYNSRARVRRVLGDKTGAEADERRAGELGR